MKPKCQWIVIVILLMAVQVHAGWIVRMSSTAPDGSKQTEIFYVENNKWKVDSQDSGSIIFDLDKGVMMIIDHQSKTVYAGDPAELSGMQDAAMKEMEEQLKNMPPEQRAMVKQMMEKQMGGESISSKSVAVEVRKTAEKSTVAGYAVQKHEIRVGGKHREDVWVTSKISLADEVDMDKLQKFMESMSVGGMEEAAYNNSPEYFGLFRQGFPLKTVIIMPGGNVVSEAVQVEKKDIPASEFSVPSGYKQRGLGEMMQSGIKD